MYKKMIFISGLLVSSVTQFSSALDANKITIHINDQLSGDTVYVQPYSGFYVSKLRGEGIETLEITVANTSAEPVTLTRSCIVDLEPLSEKTAENGLLDFPRSANQVAGALFLLIIASWFGMYNYYPVAGKTRTLANLLCGFSLLLGLPGAWVSGKIENYIWTQIAQHSLFEPVTVQPGQTVKRFVFVDKNTMLPQAYVCRVVDAQGQEHSIHADKLSVG
jgi:hypothetical protein